MAKRRKHHDGRRAPGSGYVTEAANGTFTGHFPKLPRGYHVKRGFDTRQAAEDWCNSLLTRQQANENVGKGQQKVSAWLDAWKARETREREWKPKTVADIEWKLGYVLPYIGDMALADVTPDHTDPIWDDLSTSLAPSTVRQIRSYLFDTFEGARVRRYITYNPVIKPARRKRPKQKEPIRLSSPQAALLVITAADSFYALAWWLILVLGLRSGEVCGLRWGDLDLEHGVLHVLQAVGDVRGTPTKGKPKNDKARHLPLPRALIPLFDAHRKVYVKRAAQSQRKRALYESALERGVQYKHAPGVWEENGLVFPGRGGRPMNPTNLRHQLKALTDTCKLPPVTTHMLRHTAGKFYTDHGTEHAMTKAILGHAPDITGHYAPPDPEAMRPHVDRVYHALAGEIEQQRSKTG